MTYFILLHSIFAFHSIISHALLLFIKLPNIVLEICLALTVMSWNILMAETYNHEEFFIYLFFSSFCCIPIISKILRYALWLWFSHYNLIGPGCWRCRNVWNSEKCCGHSCRFVVQLMHFVLSPFQFIRMTKKWHTNGAGFVDGLGMGNNTKVSFKWFHQFKKKKKKFNWFYIQRVPFFLPLFCSYFGSPHMCRLQSCELVWRRW